MGRHREWSRWRLLVPSHPQMGGQTRFLRVILVPYLRDSCVCVERSRVGLESEVLLLANICLGVGWC